jgi:hypothetical protein
LVFILLDNIQDAEFTAQQRKILKLDYTTTPLTGSEASENSPLLQKPASKDKKLCCSIC